MFLCIYSYVCDVIIFSTMYVATSHLVSTWQRPPGWNVLLVSIITVVLLLMTSLVICTGRSLFQSKQWCKAYELGVVLTIWLFGLDCTCGIPQASFVAVRAIFERSDGTWRVIQSEQHNSTCCRPVGPDPAAGTGPWPAIQLLCSHSLCHSNCKCGQK